MSAIVKLTDKVEDLRFETVEDCLARTAKNLQQGFRSRPGFSPTGIVIVLVEQRDERYEVVVDSSAMRAAERVGWLEIAKLNGIT